MLTSPVVQENQKRIVQLEDNILSPENTSQVNKPAQVQAGQRVGLADLQKFKVNSKTNYPAPTPVIRIAGANFGLQGMISALTGPPKSGKTTVIGFMLATAFTRLESPSESLSILTAPAGRRDVVYLDFEQHVSSTQQLHDKVLKYIGIPESPPNLHTYNLLQYSMDERRQAISAIFNELDLHLLIIDGLADILPSVNDEEKANALIEELAILASKHNTCVVVVIHENKGGGSVRGHLGSQIERKCAGLISVKKDRERKEHSIESRLIRIGAEFDNVYFSYSEEKGRMVQLDALTTQQRIEQAAQEKLGKDRDPVFLNGLMFRCFEKASTLTKTELRAEVSRIDNQAKSDKTADRRIAGAIALGIIDNQDGQYRFVPSQNPLSAI
ncbi:hypothetical protein BLX24_13805 [Arsenicibacter rosenii]|uniref:Uncharacterized protein n=2 Tax=Arsenicibacter rosenii TaxID=1750698 RepID=A0A1S2VIP6_9BACT|nr:hypothetical protein BLX24_13805 [Arsenicibacter rosenii]